jgi:hypothetical protein
LTVSVSVDETSMKSPEEDDTHESSKHNELLLTELLEESASYCDDADSESATETEEDDSDTGFVVREERWPTMTDDEYMISTDDDDSVSAEEDIVLVCVELLSTVSKVEISELLGEVSKQPIRKYIGTI